MAGYLDQYGAGDERREKRNRWLIIAGGAVLLALLLWWFLTAGTNRKSCGSRISRGWCRNSGIAARKAKSGSSWTW